MGLKEKRWVLLQIMSWMWGQTVLSVFSLIPHKLQTAVSTSLMSGQHPGTDGCCTCLCQDNQIAKAVWCWHPHSAREKPLFRHSYTGRRWVLAAQTALAQDEVNRLCSKHRFAFLERTRLIKALLLNSRCMHGTQFQQDQDFPLKTISCVMRNF